MAGHHRSAVDDHRDLRQLVDGIQAQRTEANPAREARS